MTTTIDKVHTTEERIYKIRSVFEAIQHMADNHPNDPAAIDALLEAAKEAEGSLKAIEKTILG